MADNTLNLDDLYLETDTLYVGSVCELLSGEYNTITFPEKVKYFPRSDDNGFVLHKNKINTFAEIGQKVVALKGQFDNVFYPRHYNHKGVKTWCGGQVPFTYAFYNYLVKLHDAGVLHEEQNVNAMQNLFAYVDPESSPAEIKDLLTALWIFGGLGTGYSEIGLVDHNEERLEFLDTYTTSLLMTTDLHIFDDLSNFSIKNTEWTVYIFDKQDKLTAILCKVFNDPDGIGFPMCEEACYMVSNDQDILFVDFADSYSKSTGEEFDEEEFRGPWKPSSSPV